MIPMTPEVMTEKIAALEAKDAEIEKALREVIVKMGEFSQLKTEIAQALPTVKAMIEAKGTGKIFGNLFGGKK